MADERSELSYVEVKNILSQLSKLGATQITLSGGEIFLRKDILRILEFISKLGMQIKIYSNLNLCSADIIKKLKFFSIQKVETSVYSADAAIHDKITQVAGSFKKTLRNIQIVKDAGISILFKSAFMKENIYNYEKLINMAERMGVEFSFGDFFVSQKKIDKKSKNQCFKLRRIEEKELKRLYSNPYIMKKLNLEYLVKRDFILSDENLDKPLCEAGHCKCHIQPNGDVLPCGLWLVKLGNTRRSTIRDILNNSIYSKKIRELTLRSFTTCIACDLIKYCDLCPAILYNIYHKKHERNLHVCKKAKLLYELSIELEERIKK